MECCNNKVTFIDKVKILFNKDKKNDEKDIIYQKIVLIGNPNVGKSVIFNNLTGAYVTVSNYPGTTVEVSRGVFKYDDRKYEIIDTPGMYSMLPITEEERVTRKLLLSERPDRIIHVIDAKNIERMLPLTLQLIETGIPVILVLNILDEAKILGITINSKKLENLLSIPVIKASAAQNEGLEEIRKCITEENQKVKFAKIS